MYSVRRKAKLVNKRRNGFELSVRQERSFYFETNVNVIRKSRLNPTPKQLKCKCRHKWQMGERAARQNIGSGMQVAALVDTAILQSCNTHRVRRN